jgi:hypothetical protein
MQDSNSVMPEEQVASHPDRVILRLDDLAKYLFLIWPMATLMRQGGMIARLTRKLKARIALTGGFTSEQATQDFNQACKEFLGNFHPEQDAKKVTYWESFFAQRGGEMLGILHSMAKLKIPSSTLQGRGGMNRLQ